MTEVITLDPEGEQEVAGNREISSPKKRDGNQNSDRGDPRTAWNLLKLECAGVLNMQLSSLVKPRWRRAKPLNDFKAGSSQIIDRLYHE